MRGDRGMSFEDHLIDEVRRRRADLVAAHGDDLTELGRALIERQETSSGQLVDLRSGALVTSSRDE